MSDNHDNNVVDETEETDIVIDQVPKKTRVSSKSTESKKKLPAKKKATNEEATAKRNAEKKRHKEACESAADRDLVSYFPTLVEHNFLDHLGKTVVASLLETIEYLQRVESTAPNGYNPFPASEYKLSTEPTKASREKAKPSAKGSVKPSEQPKIRRKGAKVQEPVEEEEQEEHDEQEETDMVADENEEPTQAPKARKNIAQITLSGKTSISM
jgi:hypothetical protein